MLCPYCRTPDSKVIDSRLAREGDSIRRRRACDACDKRFTTHERVEEIAASIVKKDGRREPFDRQKMRRSIQIACQKCPVSEEEIDRLVKSLEDELLELGEKEVPSRFIGERVMNALSGLNPVAYVRFASVYRSFKDAEEFMREIEHVLGMDQRK